MSSTPFNHRVTLSPEIEAINSRRIFLFAEARSGSTWLVNTLDSHPQVSMLDEIFNPDFIKNFNALKDESGTANLKGNYRFIESYLGHLSSRFAGCKILFPQALRFMDIYEFLLNYRNSFFILLYRENCVKSEISGLIANKYGRWHLVEKKEKEVVKVDPAFLHERLTWRKLTREFCTDLLGAYCPNLLRIEYEAFFSEPAQELNKIAKMLNVNPGDFSYSKEIKSNPYPLKDLIENYQECVDYFSDKPDYLSMFND